MKLLHIRREPRFHIELTRAEIETLALHSNSHYDATCRGLNGPGGIIYGFRNRLALMTACASTGPGTIEDEVTRRDVGLLCKVLEGCNPESAILYRSLRELLRTE